jgi:hypothetical protein
MPSIEKMRAEDDVPSRESGRMPSLEKMRAKHFKRKDDVPSREIGLNAMIEREKKLRATKTQIEKLRAKLEYIVPIG